MVVSETLLNVVIECRMSDILIQNEVIIDVFSLTKHLTGSYINS